MSRPLYLAFSSLATMDMVVLCFLLQQMPTNTGRTTTRSRKPATRKRPRKEHVVWHESTPP